MDGSKPARRQGKAVNRRTRVKGPAPAGPGAASVTSSGAPAPTTTLRAQLRYRFDNALARGPMVIIAYLALLSVAVIVLAALIAVVAQFTFGGARDDSFPEELWQAMLRTLDAGSFAADVAWPTRLLGLLITLIGIFLAGSLIGLIANAVDQRVEDLRRGHGPVIESGHTLILGWSSQVPRIISELVIANESEKSAAVVVLAKGDKTMMEDAVREQVGDRRSTRVVCRSGNPGLPDDLRRVGVETARSIIAVRDDDGDAGVVKAVLGVRAVDPALAGAHIVAELTEADNARTLRKVTGGAVLTVSSDDVVAEVAAQACLRSGLASVFADLLDFDGSEIYFTTAAPVAGHPYRAALLAYDASSVIGRLTADGTVELNPDGDTPLAADDQLIVVAEDDSTIVCTGVADIPASARTGTMAIGEPVRVLVVGWSRFGGKVLKELDEFLPAGSHIDVRLDPDLADPEAVDTVAMVNASLAVHLDVSGPDALLALGTAPAPDQVVVLGYRDALSADDADARTLLSLLALRSTWPAPDVDGDATGRVRIVAELLDQRHLVLADPVGVDDLIVSDALTSLLMAQLSERAELHAVFEELFDAEGSSVELLPAPALVGSDPISYGAVVAAAASLGASAFGYRRASAGEVVVNPPKSATVTLGADDQVIVIADRTALRARTTG